MSKLKDRLHQFAEYLKSEPRHIIVLRISALFILLHPYSSESLFLGFMAAVMLFYSPFLLSPFGWAVVCIESTLHLGYNFVLANNHDFLIVYWFYVCLISTVSKRPDSVLAYNARMLVGIAFLFATVWKLLAGQYLDGSFMYYKMLLDDRFEFAASVLGNMSTELLKENHAIRTAARLVATDGVSVMLNGSAGLRVWSIILSYWTLLIEGLIAYAFLVKKPGGLYRYRTLTLAVFVATTYFIVPLLGFAMLLNIFAYAQCPRDIKWLNALHITLFLLIPFITLLGKIL